MHITYTWAPALTLNVTGSPMTSKVCSVVQALSTSASRESVPAQKSNGK